jgi:hypothetical protein
MPSNAKERYIWAKERELALKKLYEPPPINQLYDYSPDSDESETESTGSQRKLNKYFKNVNAIFDYDRCFGKIPDYDNLNESEDGDVKPIT